MAGLIDDWLSEADETDTRSKRTAGETREFRLDETNRIEVPAKTNGEAKTPPLDREQGPRRRRMKKNHPNVTAPIQPVDDHRRSRRPRTRRRRRRRRCENSSIVVVRVLGCAEDVASS